MDAVQSYIAFVRACESGSFSAVARELGTSQSAVSKQIAALERDVGVQLFARTTRRLTPTLEAQTLYEHSRQLLDVIDSLRATTDRQAQASGTLRMTMPGSYGRHRICPLLPKFLDLNPDVRLEITFTDEAVDLVEEGLELAVRVGPLASSSLMARPIGIAEQVLVASKAYLKHHGRPDSPADLGDRPCIVYGRGQRWPRWDFESGNGRHSVRVTGPVRANDSDAMHDLVLSGVGIGLLPDWVVTNALKRGTIEALLDDYYPRPLPVNIVYPQTRFLSQRARSFIDFTIAELLSKR